MNKTQTRMAEVLDQIIALIEAGANGDQWVMPWAQLGRPAYNCSTGATYKGLNWFLLGMIELIEQLPVGGWGTYLQWQDMEHQVPKGCSALGVIRMPQPTTVEDKQTGEEKEVVFFKLKPVWHSSQVGYEPPTPADLIDNGAFTPHENGAYLMQCWQEAGMSISWGGDRAAYSPRAHCVYLPKPEQFFSREAYYSTAFHEATHWTSKDLDRKISSHFGSEEYALEELVAELGSAYLCQWTGVEEQPRPDHAQYIHHWLSQVKADPMILPRRMALAQKAVDHLLALAGATEDNDASGTRVTCSDVGPSVAPATPEEVTA